MTDTNQPLRRSRSSRVLAGVLGGIAERQGVDVNLLRGVFILLSVLSAAFPGIVVYLLLWAMMPAAQSATS